MVHTPSLCLYVTLCVPCCDSSSTVMPTARGCGDFWHSVYGSEGTAYAPSPPPAFHLSPTTRFTAREAETRTKIRRQGLPRQYCTYTAHVALYRVAHPLTRPPGRPQDIQETQIQDKIPRSCVIMQLSEVVFIIRSVTYPVSKAMCNNMAVSYR